MFTFILLFIISFVGLTVGVIVDKFGRSSDLDWLAGLSVSVFVFTFIALIITACTLININTRFEATKNEYAVIREMVESYDGQDYGNMTALTESVVDMNTKIARHKAHYKSKWTGLWYSEDIANLEPITFSQKTEKKEK